MSEEYSGRKGSVTLSKDKKQIQVTLRLYPLSEGWEIKKFDDTPDGNAKAYDQFNQYKREVT